jgi:hypothetical protein
VVRTVHLLEGTPCGPTAMLLIYWIHFNVFQFTTKRPICQPKRCSHGVWYGNLVAKTRNAVERFASTCRQVFVVTPAVKLLDRWRRRPIVAYVCILGWSVSFVCGVTEVGADVEWVSRLAVL